MSNATPVEVLARTSPAAAEAFGQLRRAVSDGLDPATNELVVVASLAARGELGSLAVHVRRALRSGVPAHQLRSAVVATLAASTLFGEVVAALRAIDDVVAAEGAEDAPSTGSAQATHPPQGSDPAQSTWSQAAAPARQVEGPLSATLYAPTHPDAVVLLHSLALDRRIWSPLIDALATHLAVLAVDLPGHGRSPGAPQPDVRAMADMVAATMAGAGVDRAAVAGMSFGGSVAQALAVGHPDRVRALALLDTTACYGPGAPEAWAKRLATARERGMPALSQFQLDRWFSDDFRQRRPDICDATLAIFSATDLDGYAAACTALGAMDLLDDIRTVACPTAVVVGEHDPATPLSHAQEIHTRIPGSELHVIEGCKHLSAVERPAAVLAAIAGALGA